MGADPTFRRTRAEARIGRTLSGKWCLEAVLGVGGLGTVYRARHRNGRVAAVKLLHADATTRMEPLEVFRKEGYAANRVDHPGAVAVLDDGISEEGEPYLVMELLEGETLQQRWLAAGKALPAADVARTIVDVLAILERAHARGVVHCDVKPANIFVCASAGTKLLDFGMASFRGENADGEASSSSSESGFARGTPAFMSPEQATGDRARVRACSDIFAIGATMFVLLSGQHVHEGTSPQVLVIAAATRAARSLRDVLPAADARLACIVDRALAFDPGARWSSAAEMRAALESMLASEGSVASLESITLDVPLPAMAPIDRRERVVGEAAPSGPRGGEDRPPVRRLVVGALGLGGALLLATVWRAPTAASTAQSSSPSARSSGEAEIVSGTPTSAACSPSGVDTSAAAPSSADQPASPPTDPNLLALPQPPRRTPAPPTPRRSLQAASVAMASSVAPPIPPAAPPIPPAAPSPVPPGEAGDIFRLRR